MVQCHAGIWHMRLVRCLLEKSMVPTSISRIKVVRCCCTWHNATFLGFIDRLIVTLTKSLCRRSVFALLTYTQAYERKSQLVGSSQTYQRHHTCCCSSDLKIFLQT